MPKDSIDSTPEPPARKSPSKKAKTTARARKSATAFRTISEVSAELDVAQHVLRFWETKFRQVSPMKRAGGRRFYRPEDVELLKHIRHWLKNERYTIEGVQKLLNSGAIKIGADPSHEDMSELSEARPPEEPQKLSVPGLETDTAPALSQQSIADTRRPQLLEILDELKTLRAEL